jgi:hypothetical protein
MSKFKSVTKAFGGILGLSAPKQAPLPNIPVAPDPNQITAQQTAALLQQQIGAQGINANLLSNAEDDMLAPTTKKTLLGG